MLQNQLSHISILDCSLRDGGYYTKWDFDEDLVDSYFKCLNGLPIEYVEIGYRSLNKQEYAGAFYYLPKPILELCKVKSKKKLAIILNEKEISEDDFVDLLNPCIGIINLVRLAVSPNNLSRAVIKAKIIRGLGFKVAFNLMYASKWKDELFENKELIKLNEIIDYFYVVDSYGGMLPDDVIEVFNKITTKLSVPIGFHGHDNLELAFANSLAAIKSGAKLIDCTIGGMGRGAGNLKTELLLSLMSKNNPELIDFDILNHISAKFNTLKETYKWGTNLPYMVSGIHSLPQDTIMSKVNKRFYSLNAYVDNISTLDGHEMLTNIPEFINQKVDRVLIIGGGTSPLQFRDVLLPFLKKNNDIVIVYASSKNVNVFATLENSQIHCLPGREARRLETKKFNINNHIFVIPQEGYYSNTYLPTVFHSKSFKLIDLKLMERFEDSITAMALDITFKLNPELVYITGYDGYGVLGTKEEKELYEENQKIFDQLVNTDFKLLALTPTQYNISTQSIYSLI